MKRPNTGVGLSEPCNGVFNTSVGLNSITYVEKGDPESRLSFTGVCSVYVSCVFIEECSSAVLLLSRKTALGFTGWP